MNEPFFSILVPVFNQKGKMDSCLDAIKSQGFEDYEVIFVDDGSTDGSYEYLLSLADADKRYRVFRHEQNRSLLCARYTGMENAAGRYILFLDSDDGIESDTLEVLHAHLEKQHYDVTRFGFVTVPGGDKLPAPDCDDPLKGVLNGMFPPAIWKNCISSRIAKKAVENITPFYCNNGEDTFMSATLYTFAESFSRLDRCFYLYTTDGGMSREGTLTMAKLDRILQSFDNCMEHLTKFIAEHRPDLNDLCLKACLQMYRFEICHFLLCTPDERLAVEFLCRFNTEKLSDVFEYGCREVLPEYFARKRGIFSEDKMRFLYF